MLIFDTLAGQKREFTPLNDNKIGMYVCGITVYDLCHIGHARVMVSFDVIVRYLRAQGYEVNYIRNITDVDDKIFARAAERGIPFDQLTQEFIEAMHVDLAALGCEPPSAEPRATGHMAEIISLIERLMEAGAAYQGESGDVYFRVSAFDDYGKLNNRKLEDMLAGARVDVAGDKESAADFVLWKAAKAGEAAWPSPYGDGRPGWHIECSAMSMKALGETFDIHGGGPDLKFPHHENEIAQSEAATCKPYANYWMHAGAVRVDNEKMSKSLGNFFTIREVLEKYHPEVVRFFLLSSHYRGHINYSDAGLEQAAESLSRIYRALRDQSIGPASEPWIQKFDAAMQDDFNTPLALSQVFEAVREINVTGDPALVGFIQHVGSVFNLFQQDPATFTVRISDAVELDESWIAERIEARAQAKRDRDFEQADAIRTELAEAGVEIEDSREGTRWSYK